MFLFSMLSGELLATESVKQKKQYPLLPYSNEFGGSFKLTDHTGKQVTEKDYLGKFVILYFGYTGCADICPLALNSIGQALKQIDPQSKNVIPLFVNLDTTRLSLVDLERYVHYFNPSFIGLTGTDRSIAMAAGAYGVRYRSVKNNDGSKTIEHSGKIFLLNRSSKVLTYFPHEASIDWIATVTDRFVKSNK